MENFYIKQGATLPVLLMKIDSDNQFLYEKFQSGLENSAISFSMINTENNHLQIAKKTGGIIPYEGDDKVDGETGYYIYYKFTTKDTEVAGNYKGEFKIDFYNTKSGIFTGTLVAPFSQDLNIIILASLFK